VISNGIVAGGRHKKEPKPGHPSLGLLEVSPFCLIDGFGKICQALLIARKWQAVTCCQSDEAASACDFT
jgi:hypothetical protein